MNRFWVLADGPSRRLLPVVLMLALTTAACAGNAAPSDGTPPGPVTGLTVSAVSDTRIKRADLDR